MLLALLRELLRPCAVSGRERLMRGVEGLAHSVAGPVRLCTEVRVVRVMLVELVQVLTGKEATYEYVRRPNRGEREGREKYT
jgi:hypothetical protein